jgi:hypothetical protein
VLALLASIIATPLYAELPGTAYIFPAGAPAGSKATVRVGGYFLHESAPWTIAGPNVAASPRLTHTDKIWFEGPLIRQPASQGKEDYPADYLGEIAIDADASPGIRRWSVRTDQGVTPGLPFVIGRLPEVVEQETDGEPIPVAVALPVVINGRTFPRQDVDVWTFEAQAGQVVTCTVLAARIGSPVISRLEIRGPDGGVLTEDVGSLAGDAFVQFTAPTAGRYAVHIHDAEFGGLQHYVYRLLITAGPFVTGVFPLGGRPGETLDVELRGANLPANTAQVKLPEAPEEIYWWHPDGLAAGELGIPIDVAPGIAVCEAEPNDESTPQSLASSQPDHEMIINGVIDRAGDVDHFSFDARPGAPVRIKVRAAALGSLLDSVITVIGPNGQQIAQADDVGGSPDASLAFTPAMEGPHQVAIQDRIPRRGGPDYAYRLHVAVGPGQPASPFELRVPVDAVNVDRGGKATLRVDIQRFNFNEPIELSCPELPAGVTLAGGSVPAGGVQANLTFEAQPAAKLGLQALQIVGTAQREATEIRAVATIPVQPGESPKDTIALSLNMPTPFKIYGRFESKFSPRGSVYVRHYFIDRNGYAGPLEISLADRQNWHLQGVTGPKIVVPAGVDEFDYPLLLAPWMELGRTSRTCLMAVGNVPLEEGATARVAFTSQEQNDQIIVLTAPSRMELALAKTSFIAAENQTVELPLRIERDAQLTEPTTVELVCPPHMPVATADKLTVLPGDKSGALAIRFPAGRLPAINMPVTIRATTKDERGFPVVTEAPLEIVVKAP